MEVINGKVYPLWSQFVERKNEWVGGILHDRECDPTEIVDILLKANGEDSAFFEIVGKEYSCGFDVKHGGISPNGAGDNALHFSVLYGLNFSIEKRSKR